MIPDARRLEELTLNSSAPPGQLLYDGWLLRLAPGKAKRARSVNALYPGRLALDEKIAHCERLYAERRIPAIFRITPFCEPPLLDAELERRGYGRFDETAVETAPIDARAAPGAGVQPLELPEWIDAVSELRRAPARQREAHLQRLAGIALPKRAVAVREGGRVVATGLTIVEDDAAGLFDIVVHEAARGRGHARAVVATLLALARELGARDAYLQVQAGNAPARALYRQFGFEERYVYWYRGRPGEQE